MITELLAVATCGFMDRLRGDAGGFGKALECMVYGFALWFLITGMLDFTDIVVWFFAFLWWVGAMPGWGPYGTVLHDASDPWDPNEEWWIVKPFNTDPVLALAVRGLLWGFPVGLLLLLTEHRDAFWVPSMAMCVALPGANLITHHWLWPVLKHYSEMGDLFGYKKPKWNLSEFVRGALFGLIVLLVCKVM